MATRNITVNRKTAPVVAQQKGPSRRVRVTRTSPAGKARTLFFFQMTPGGALLRAYMLAMILCQIGAIRAGAAFKLWPYANVAGHLANGRMKRGDAKGTFTLTQSGVNYFNDDAQKPEKETLAGMMSAVKKGEKPPFYKYELCEMKLS